MSKGEFEDRDRQHPGDTFATSGLYMAGKRKHGLSQVPLGAPNVGFDVRSVFDSRPVLSSDFLTGVLATPVLVDANNARFSASFFVPPGYICILREAHISISPNLLAPLPADIAQEPTTTGEFTRNAAPITNAVVAVGSPTFPAFGSFFILNDQKKYPTFLLADENDAVGLNVYMYDSAEPTAYTVLANFSGQFLLKSGVAYPFEIANKT